MSRVSLNPDTRFEIDKCGKCDGVWLDLGELEHIRAEDKSVTERKEKLAAYEQATLKGIDDAKMKLSVKSLLRKFF
jgi:Zn-finger nucleic acid-binding protein